MTHEATASRLSYSHQSEGSAFGLVVISYPQRSLNGLRIPIGERLLIGRLPPKDGLALNQDARTSRLHAVIERRDGGLWVRDEQSKNGTFRNGERVTEVCLAVGDLLRIGDTLLELDVFDVSSAERAAPAALVGDARIFRETLAQVERLAQNGFMILLEGETGSGKELLARFAHTCAERSGEFVAVNCAAIPETLFESFMFGHTRGSFTGATQDARGVFERASQGTLFLDEIGELPLAQQAKLLRVLETQDVTPVGSSKTLQASAQIVAATNADIGPSEHTSFRRDLYARFASGIVHVPPLRARKLDVLPLLHFFLQGVGVNLVDLQISPDVIERLVLAPWPLNLRELRALAQKVALEARPASETAVNARLARALGLPVAAPRTKEVVRAEATLVGAAHPTVSMPVFREEPAAQEKAKRRSPPKQPMEREAFVRVLREQKGNIVRIADALGHDRKQIYRWLKRFALRLEDFR